MPRRQLRMRSQLTAPSEPSPSPSPPLSRPPRRAAARRSEELTSITVESSALADPEESTTVTLKMSANKLRAATRGARNVLDSRDSYGSAASQRAPRSTRAKRAVVIESDSDDDEEENDEDEAMLDEDENDDDDDDDEDAEGEDDEAAVDMDEDAEGEDDDAEGEDEDAEGEDDEDADAEGEDDMDIVPTPARRPLAKPTVTVTPAAIARVQSVESKEMQMMSAATTDDEELSELPSDGVGSGPEDDDDEMDDDMDAEGETDDGIGTPGSRDSTPDVTKLTKRQRSRLDQVMGSDFLQLPMEPQIKKHLTAEEHAMRRAEMARRRKNLSEKRNEEEKMDTINRLLKKQAPKRRGKISAAELAAGTGPDTPDPAASAEDRDDGPPSPADPVFARYISRADATVLAVPAAWREVPGVAAWAGRSGWRAVEEVEG